MTELPSGGTQEDRVEEWLYRARPGSGPVVAAVHVKPRSYAYGMLVGILAEPSRRSPTFEPIWDAPRTAVRATVARRGGRRWSCTPPAGCSGSPTHACTGRAPSMW